MRHPKSFDPGVENYHVAGARLSVAGSRLSDGDDVGVCDADDAQDPRSIRLRVIRLIGWDHRKVDCLDYTGLDVTTVQGFAERSLECFEALEVVVVAAIDSVSERVRRSFSVAWLVVLLVIVRIGPAAFADSDLGTVEEGSSFVAESLD